jgi:transglutaminase-like putative cysteine protease
MLPPGRTVSAGVTFQVETDATIVLQLAAARTAAAVRSEELRAEGVNGRSFPCVTLDGEHGGRLHRLQVPPGPLTVSYRAELEMSSRSPGAESTDSNGTASELEQLIYLRPSRYCPSDHVVGWAVAEFGQLPSPRERVGAMAGWINERIAYRSGASTVHDSAEDTLLTGAGVCRDFAHLGIVLCRALGVPARFASVYAPGLQPMDFHAVFEAWLDGSWWAYDTTRMAPRPTLVRIATGRDAADTPFATVVSGIATLLDVNVTVTSEGRLPVDRHDEAVALG